jgi:hypothetical protein
MTMALKYKNNEFLVTPLKNVLSVMGFINHPGILKLWTIAYENGHKHKNNEFFIVINLHRTPNCGQ